MRKPSRRGTVLATAVAGTTVALGVGGFAYAASGDPATPEQGYVVVEDGPGTTPGHSDGRDCPEKNGGQGDEQDGESQSPSQSPSESPSESPSQSSQADPQGQA